MFFSVNQGEMYDIYFLHRKIQTKLHYIKQKTFTFFYYNSFFGGGGNNSLKQYYTLLLCLNSFSYLKYTTNELCLSTHGE